MAVWVVEKFIRFAIVISLVLAILFAAIDHNGNIRHKIFPKQEVVAQPSHPSAKTETKIAGSVEPVMRLDKISETYPVFSYLR